MNGAPSFLLILILSGIKSKFHREFPRIKVHKWWKSCTIKHNCINVDWEDGINHLSSAGSLLAWRLSGRTVRVGFGQLKPIIVLFSPVRLGKVLIWRQLKSRSDDRREAQGCWPAPIYGAGQFILFLMLKGRDLLGIHSIQSSYTQHHLHSLTNIKNWLKIGLSWSPFYVTWN